MTHRAQKSGSARLGGFTGRVLAIAAAAALCVAAIAVTVSVWNDGAPEPRPVLAPSGSVPSTRLAPVVTSTPTASAAAASAAPASPTSAEPTTTMHTTVPPAVTPPAVTRPPATRCTPQPKWVYRPSTGTYERITVLC